MKNLTLILLLFLAVSCKKEANLPQIGQKMWEVEEQYGYPENVITHYSDFGDSMTYDYQTKKVLVKFYNRVVVSVNRY